VELAKEAGLLLEGRRNLSTMDIVVLGDIPAADLKGGKNYQPQKYLKTVRFNGREGGQDSMQEGWWNDPILPSGANPPVFDEDNGGGGVLGFDAAAGGEDVDAALSEATAKVAELSVMSFDEHVGGGGELEFVEYTT
jgi:hypothetical protein